MLPAAILFGATSSILKVIALEEVCSDQCAPRAGVV